MLQSACRVLRAPTLVQKEEDKQKSQPALGALKLLERCKRPINVPCRGHHQAKTKKQKLAANVSVVVWAVQLSLWLSNMLWKGVTHPVAGCGVQLMHVGLFFDLHPRH
jgi:hypothetical protein